MKRFLALLCTVVLLLGSINNFAIAEVVSTYSLGDANLSGEIDVIDAMVVLQHITGKTTLNGEGFSMGDINMDNAVTVDDALKILQHITGKITIKNNTVSDVLNIGDSISEKSHLLATTGNVLARSRSIETGLITNDYNIKTMYKKGDTISFVMDASVMTPADSNEPVMLLISEVLEGYNAYGYTVLVDDKEVYFRNYEPILDTVNYYFVKVNRTYIKDLKSVKITLKNESDNAVSINSVVCYGDFYGLCEKEGIFARLQVDNYAPGSATSQGINTSINTALANLPEFNSFDVGTNAGYSYMQTSRSGMRTYIDTILQTSQNNSKYFYAFDPSTYWGATAQGPDGKGGYFSDLQYHQIIYNSQTNGYRASTPNNWGNTKWNTFNNQNFNDISIAKNNNFGEYLSNALSIKQASGFDASKLDIVVDQGYGYAIASIMQGGDFGNQVVADALKDGVVLDPADEDGLSPKEIQWMIKNMARFNELLTKGYKDGLGSSGVVIKNNQTILPTYQMFDNIYTHIGDIDLFPGNSVRAPHWQSCIIPSAWPSGEQTAYSDKRGFDMIISHGKLSSVNIYLPMMTTQEMVTSYFKSMYQYGSKMINMYGFTDRDAVTKAKYQEWLKGVDNLENLPALAPIEYKRSTFNYNIMRDYPTSYKLDTKDMTFTNIVTNNYSNTAGYLAAKDQTVPAEITFKASDINKYINGGILEIEAETKDKGSIAVYAGTTPDNLSFVKNFEMGTALTWHNKASIDAIDISSIVRGNQDLYVKLVVNTAGSVDNAKVRGLYVYLPWEKTTGQLQGDNTTLKQKRIQSLWIQSSGTSKRMMKNYLDKNNRIQNEAYKKAQNLWNNANYQGCYKYMSGEISLLLPALFTVEGSGKLANYPVNVTLPQADAMGNIKLLQLGKTKAEFSLFSLEDMNMSIEFTDLDNGNYSLTQLEENKYILEKTDSTSGALFTAVNNKLTLNLTSKKETVNIPKNKTFEGRYLGGNNTTNIWAEFQDSEINDLGESATLSLATGCVFTRGADGSTITNSDKPKLNDKVLVTLNEQGLVSRVQATYGKVIGKIKNYQPPVVKGENFTNGYVELESGEKYEISFRKDFTKLETATFNSLAVATDITALQTAFKAGMTVDITYCPVTYNNTMKKAILIKQILQQKLSFDFKTDAYMTPATNITNLTALQLMSNSTTWVLQPQTAGIGTAEYTLNLAEKASYGAIRYTGRAYTTGNYVKIYVKKDDGSWINVGGLKEYDRDMNKIYFLDVSDYIKDATKVSLKLEIKSTTGSWGSLSSLVFAVS